MSFYIQYHNCDKRGLKYLVAKGRQCAITSRRPNVKDAQGTIFLIMGVGRPRQFFLWEALEIEGVDEEGDGSFVAYGPGWRLCPPQRLEGADFDAFKNSCANFVGFRKIDDLPYCATLKKLTKKHRSEKPMKPFLQELLGLLKEGTEDYEIVEKLLGGQAAAPKQAKTPAPNGGTNKKGVPNLQAEAKPTHSAKQGRTEGSLELDSQNVKNLRALSIRQPHAEAIMRGIKKIEYRSRPTKIRGRVQIYASLGRYSKEIEAEMLEEYGIKDTPCDDLPRGVLVGTVEISNCTEDDGEFHWHLEKPKRAAKLLKPKKQPQPVWFNPF